MGRAWRTHKLNIAGYHRYAAGFGRVQRSTRRFYKNMFAKCPAGRPGTADEVANLAEILLSERGAFITGADFLIDGGATASYFYGPLKP